MNVTSSAGVVRIEAVLGNTSDGMIAKCFGGRPFDRLVLKSKEILKQKDIGLLANSVVPLTSFSEACNIYSCSLSYIS